MEDYVSLIQEFYEGYAPAVILLIGGLLALLIVHTYRKDDESWKYKAAMALGFVFGIVMIVMMLPRYATWELFTTLAVILLGFTLIIRPFREVEFAVILALVVIVISYVSLGHLDGVQWLELLASGWPRVIVAFLLGVIVYVIANFVEKLIMLFGKLFNWWPFLALLALICIVEAVFLLIYGESVYDTLMALDLESWSA